MYSVDTVAIDMYNYSLFCFFGCVHHSAAVLAKFSRIGCLLLNNVSMCLTINKTVSLVFVVILFYVK